MCIKLSKDLQDIRNGLLQKKKKDMHDDLRRMSKIQNVDKPSLVGTENLSLQIMCSIYKHSAQVFSLSIL